MPPRKNSASVAVAKSSKARAAKTASTTASKKAPKSAAERSTTTKAAVSKKKPTTKPTATSTKANISKKRQRADDDDEEESEADTKPKSKKTRTGGTSLKAAATKKNEKAKSIAKATNTTAAKRKADDSDDSDDATPPPKKAKVSVTKKAISKKAAPKKAVVPKKVVDPIMKVKIGPKINTAPTTPLDIYVFGEGSAGELGLGAKVVDKKRPIDVMRPRKNILLSAPEVGVVQLACGGMHGLALTKDNKILSWGVNDQGALGRNTQWNGGLRDVDAPDSESEDEDDTGLNPLESTPAEIDMSGVAPLTKFVQVTACDSASFALTEDGRIYGWGTFRVSLTTAHSSILLTDQIHSPAMVFLGSLQTSRFRKSLFCCPSPQRLFPSQRAPIMS